MGVLGRFFLVYSLVCGSDPQTKLYTTNSTKTYKIIFLHFYSTKYHRQQPLYNTLELLMMGIVMPETC